MVQLTWFIRRVGALEPGLAVGGGHHYHEILRGRHPQLGRHAGDSRTTCHGEAWLAFQNAPLATGVAWHQANSQSCIPRTPISRQDVAEGSLKLQVENQPRGVPRLCTPAGKGRRGASSLRDRVSASSGTRSSDTG